MLTTDNINYIYSGLLVVGGTIGFLKAGSIPSLAAGLGTGLLVFGFQQNNWAYKTVAISAISGLMTYVMGARYLRSHKIMPAGIIAAASIVTLVAQLARLNQTRSLH